MKDSRTTYLVFFSPQKNEPDKYRVLLSGKETNIFLTKHDIMKILNTIQLRDFMKEIGIYEVEKRILDPYLSPIKEPEIPPKERWKPL